MRALQVLLFASTALTACSWSVYNDYKSDTPMFAISNRAFGARVAITTDTEGNAIVGAGGVAPDGARFYGLGQGTSEPSGAPLTNSAQCEIASDKITAGSACLSATTLSPAGVLQELDAKTATLKQVHPGCFAIGYGRRSDTSDIEPGPIVYCTDGGLYTMKPAGDSGLAKAFASRNEQEIRAQHVAMATVMHDGKSVNPGIVVATDVDERAWVYPTIRSQVDPIEITAAADTRGEKYGAAVAMARSKGAHIFLVSAPGIGKVFAWTVDEKTATSQNVACLEGSVGLGETLHAANFDGDADDDLFVNDGGTIKVFLGKDRPAAPAAGQPCAKWPESSIVLKCEEKGATGCATSGFGSTVAVGDFNKDGKKDVAIGAPFAVTDGVASGAVYLYSPTVGGTNEVLDVRYLGKPQENAAFGASVASGLVGTQDTLVVGARGKNVAYVVWCTGLPGTAGSARCRK